MPNITYENIKTDFCKLSHLDPVEAENYSSLIKSAQESFKKLLLREPTEDEIPSCEYTAACKAFYSYTVLRAASEKTYSSTTGGMFRRSYDTETVSAAENLFRQAVSSLPNGLASDCGFVFEGVRG